MARHVAYEFHGFRFEPAGLHLIFAGQIDVLTAKAADTLEVLVRHPDTVVTKEDLLTAVWPGTVVEENNLNQQISALRKVFAKNGRPDLIETIRQRGYRVAGPVRVIDRAIQSGATQEPAESEATSVTVRSSIEPRREPPIELPNLVRPRRRVLWGTAGAAAIILAIGVSIGWQWYGQQSTEQASNAAEGRGQALMRQGNPRAATGEYQQAIRLNPSNAPAHAGLAHALQGYSDAPMAIPRVARSASLEAAERSVELDPACGPCHGTLGFFLFYHAWKWARAEEQLRDAIRREPNHEAIRPSYAMLLSATGRQEQALEQIDFALQRSPYQFSWMQIRMTILYLQHQYLESIAAADETLRIENRRQSAWDYRSKALFQLGRGVEAMRAAQVAFPARSAELDKAVHDDGVEGGLRMLLEITSGSNARIEQSWRRAAWRALLGDVDGALDELQEAVRSRRFDVIYLGVDPVFDGLRTHPRFQDLLGQTGLDRVLTRGGKP